MAKKTLAQLQREAITACVHRKHDMGKFQPYNSNTQIQMRSVCRKCNRDVVICQNPLPNGIDISGEAVALNCDRFYAETTIPSSKN